MAFSSAVVVITQLEYIVRGRRGGNKEKFSEYKTAPIHVYSEHIVLILRNRYPQPTYASVLIQQCRILGGTESIIIIESYFM